MADWATNFIKGLPLAGLILLGGVNGAWAQERWTPSWDTNRSVFWADLGSARSKYSAQGEWMRLQRKYAYLFGGASPWFEETRVANLGVFVRITVGPFASKQAATAICSEIIRNGDTCMVKIRW